MVEARISRRARLTGPVPSQLHVVVLPIEYFELETLAWQDGTMSNAKRGGARRESEHQRYRADVAAYVAAGGEESVQRVITAVHGLARRMNQWYAHQLADLDLSAGEWGVLARLATSGDGGAMTPSQLAEATNVAASSMTHRLDRMAQRGLIARAADPDNRTRVLVTLTRDGWATFKAAIREANLVESDVLAPLTHAQREQLASLLEVVIAGLDEVAPG